MSFLGILRIFDVTALPEKVGLLFFSKYLLTLHTINGHSIHHVIYDFSIPFSRAFPVVFFVMYILNGCVLMAHTFVDHSVRRLKFTGYGCPRSAYELHIHLLAYQQAQALASVV